MSNPGWLENRLDAAIDRMLLQRGLAGGITEAEARANRLADLHLESFAQIWRQVASELRHRVDHGLDA